MAGQIPRCDEANTYDLISAGDLVEKVKRKGVESASYGRRDMEDVYVKRKRCSETCLFVTIHIALNMR